MGDSTYDQLLDETSKISDDIQEETHLKEELTRQIRDKIEGLIDTKDETEFKNRVKRIIEDLTHREGFEPEDVIEYLTELLGEASPELPYSIESIVKEMKLKEQEDTFSIMYDDLDSATQQELLEFLGLESPEDGNLEYNPIAVVPKPEEEEPLTPEEEAMPPVESPVESKVTEQEVKDAEEILKSNRLGRKDGITDEQVVAAAKNLTQIADIQKKTNESADVSKDVSELIKQTKDALTAGDYVKAADLAGRLSAIQQTIPDGIDADAAKAAKEEEVLPPKREASSEEEEKDNPCKKEESTVDKENEEKNE